jgi:hypothetical protein
MLRQRHQCAGRRRYGAGQQIPDATAESMTPPPQSTDAPIVPDGPDDWRKIVIGYDGSEAAKRALAHAGRLVSERTRVVVIAVAEPYPPERDHRPREPRPG